MSTRDFRGVAALALFAALLTAGTTGALSSARGETGPDAHERVGRLYDVEAIATDDVWAVGCCLDHRGSISHWDGEHWQASEVPEGTAEMYGVDGLSSTDVWAVGHNGIVHWDGVQWTTSLVSAGANLEGVSALSASDVWAVGDVYSGAAFRASVLHWDGVAWDVTGFYPSGNCVAVSALAPSDVWITCFDYPGHHYIKHWDGTAWRGVHNPDPAFGAFGVQAVSASDVWFVGRHDGAGAEIEHWNGKKLTVAVGPKPDQDSFLSDVGGVSPTDIWAVGLWPYDKRTGYHALTMHWDGVSWRRVKPPSMGNHKTELSGVAAITSDDAWAVGSHCLGHHQGCDYQVLAHWDGTAWTASGGLATPRPTPAAQSSERSGVRQGGRP